MAQDSNCEPRNSTLFIADHIVWLSCSLTFFLFALLYLWRDQRHYQQMRHDRQHDQNAARSAQFRFPLRLHFFMLVCSLTMLSRLPEVITELSRTMFYAVQIVTEVQYLTTECCGIVIAMYYTGTLLAGTSKLKGGACASAWSRVGGWLTFGACVVMVCVCMATKVWMMVIDRRWPEAIQSYLMGSTQFAVIVAYLYVAYHYFLSYFRSRQAVTVGSEARRLTVTDKRVLLMLCMHMVCLVAASLSTVVHFQWGSTILFDMGPDERYVFPPYCSFNVTPYCLLNNVFWAGITRIAFVPAVGSGSSKVCDSAGQARAANTLLAQKPSANTLTSHTEPPFSPLMASQRRAQGSAGSALQLSIKSRGSSNANNAGIVMPLVSSTIGPGVAVYGCVHQSPRLSSSHPLSKTRVVLPPEDGEGIVSVRVSDGAPLAIGQAGSPVHSPSFANMERKSASCSPPRISLGPLVVVERKTSVPLSGETGVVSNGACADQTPPAHGES